MPATATGGIEPRSAQSVGPSSAADAVFRGVCRLAASGILILGGLLLVVLIVEATPFLHSQGLRFLTETPWNPGGASPIYGGLALIYGTLITSAIALTIAAPMGIGAAIY